MLAIVIWSATAIALLGHALVWTGAVNILHGFRGPRVLIKLATILCVAIFVAAPLAAVRWLWLNSPDQSNLFLAGSWLGPYARVCVAYGVLGFVRKLWVEHHRNDAETLVEWTTQARNPAKAIDGPPFIGAYARALGSLPGNEVLALSIDRKRLALRRLPPELEGLTIAHMSDFHMTGRVGRGYYEMIARAVNDLRPDVIAITGDIVESDACLPWLADTIGALCAPLGVYYILGNHDLFIDAARTRALLDGAGLTNVGCRWLRAEWNGVRVTLGGNELPWLGPAPSLEQLSRRRHDHPEFRVALCHTPDQFHWCVQADVDLALAGHTHGGQVRVPVLGVIGSPSLHGTRYACGIFRRRDVVLHVSRGLGGQTPLRFLCPPELALLELTAAPRDESASSRPRA